VAAEGVAAGTEAALAAATAVDNLVSALAMVEQPAPVTVADLAQALAIAVAESAAKDNHGWALATVAPRSRARAMAFALATEMDAAARNNEDSAQAMAERLAPVKVMASAPAMGQPAELMDDTVSLE